MGLQRKNALKAVEYIKSRVKSSPSIGFLTGTGLSESIGSLNIVQEIDYRDIPYFPVSTVESHTGKLIFGRLSGKEIVVMQGRVHLYEGYTPNEVTFPVRVMQEIGVKTLIISNAAGGINLNFSPGDIMIIQDHINLTGMNPLTGKNEDAWGIRFPDMIQAYDRHLIDMASAVALELNIPFQTGVYAGMCGPSLETPAETRFLKIIGSDAIGFSTVMEVIVGVHAGMKILGLAVITNLNDPDAPEPATLEGVLEVARKASISLEQLVESVVARL